MQWLTLVPEDAGVQRLKANNRRPLRARSIDAIAPYPSTHSATLAADKTRRQQPVQDRRQGERRQNNNRRQQQTAVLLNTRSQHDRRGINKDRRQPLSSGKDTQTTASQRRRVNLYA